MFVLLFSGFDTFHVKCSIYVLAKPQHQTVLVLSITVGKVYFTEHTEMCWWKDQFFKNKHTYGIKSLSQHFEKEIYQYVNITWLLLKGKHLY